MVSRNVSRVLMASTSSAGSRCRELKPMTARNRNANQGMVILRFSLFPPAAESRRARMMLRMTSTGASIITRIILTMMAGSEMACPMALPAPTTWATS